MKHVRILSKAAEGDPGTGVLTTTDLVLSIFSVIASMVNILLQWKNLPPVTTP
jgi:hypothetical protein